VRHRAPGFYCALKDSPDARLAHVCRLMIPLQVWSESTAAISRRAGGPGKGSVRNQKVPPQRGVMAQFLCPLYRYLLCFTESNFALQSPILQPGLPAHQPLVHSRRQRPVPLGGAIVNVQGVAHDRRVSALRRELQAAVPERLVGQEQPTRLNDSGMVPSNQYLVSSTMARALACVRWEDAYEDRDRVWH